MRAALFLFVILVACKSESKDSGAHAGSATTTGGVVKKDDELIKEVPPADGIAWKRAETPFGTAELPDGGGWTRVDDQVEHTDGTVVMLQSQGGIQPAQLADYLASYDEVQKRDAPKYAKGKETVGSVKGNTAARVEATFDNGTKFDTRDYIIITPTGTVAMVGGRAPTGASATRLAAIVDHITATAQIK